MHKVSLDLQYQGRCCHGAEKKLSEKFASENHAGSVDISDFLLMEDQEEIEMTRRDAYEQVKSLLELIQIDARTREVKLNIKKAYDRFTTIYKELLRIMNCQEKQNML